MRWVGTVLICPWRLKRSQPQSTPKETGGNHLLESLHHLCISAIPPPALPPPPLPTLLFSVSVFYITYNKMVKISVIQIICFYFIAVKWVVLFFFLQGYLKKETIYFTPVPQYWEKSITEAFYSLELGFSNSLRENNHKNKTSHFWLKIRCYYSLCNSNMNYFTGVYKAIVNAITNWQARKLCLIKINKYSQEEENSQNR